jgi:fermentation-respiration switch protein FrsA (DUF1100 family)
VGTIRRSVCAGIAFAAIAGVAGACSSDSTTASPSAVTAGGTESQSNVTTTTTAVPATYSVGERVVTFVDETRSTAKNRFYPGATNRSLRTRLYYPEVDGAPARAGAPFPLVLYSHGFTGSPEAYSRLLQEIAAAGYVVAAPQYPLTHATAPGGPTLADVVNQPADAGFVIDQVIEGRQGTEFLRGLVDGDRIGVGGHSLGGITTYGLAYNSCCTHAGIKAAFPIAGAASAFPRETFFADNTPLLAIHGDHDDTVSYSSGHDAWERAQAPKYFLTVINGEHSSEARGGTTPKQRVVAESILLFLDAYVRGNRDALTELTAIGDTSGLTKLEKQS